MPKRKAKYGSQFVNWLAPLAVSGSTPGRSVMPMLSKEARRDRQKRTERLAAIGAHPDDGERPTERWDKGL